MTISQERLGDVSRGATEGLLAQPRPTLSPFPASCDAATLPRLTLYLKRDPHDLRRMAAS